MTTQNTPGTLTNRIILSAGFDHTGTVTGTIAEKEPRIGPSTYFGPRHWQDTVPDGIMDRTLGRDATFTPPSTRIATSLVPGNEFELDVESLTHTWQTVSTVTPLPGLAEKDDGDGESNMAQIQALNIDLGQMREIMSVQGVLYDADIHPSSTSGHHIRRQQLLDIARTQWGNVHNYNRANAFEWNNANKYPALTIGPMHGRATTGTNRDSGYYGDEPSSDVRGSQQREIDWARDGVALTATDVVSYSTFSWDYVFSYKGRRRYRGLIRRLTLTALAGQPNIWRYNFDFEIIKNEMELRMIPYEAAEDLSDGYVKSGPWWKFGFG